MTLTDALNIITAGIISIGGGGLLVYRLSSWLGKVWAERIFLDKTHSLSVQLEGVKQNLDILKTNALRFQNDKILAYREITDMLARLLPEMDAQGGRLYDWNDDMQATLNVFHSRRLKIYGDLVMLAPQSVMDAYDHFVDHLLHTVSGEIGYLWSEVHEKFLFLLNTIREDVGLASGHIVYKIQHST